MVIFDTTRFDWFKTMRSEMRNIGSLWQRSMRSALFRECYHACAAACRYLNMLSSIRISDVALRHELVDKRYG
jgi:hypothetical protein